MSPGGSATTRPDKLGRVSFNPLKHIDPFGTVVLPGDAAAVAFAVPVRLCQAGAGEFPQPATIPASAWSWVALAGPATNILLALMAAAAAARRCPFVPADSMPSGCSTT